MRMPALDPIFSAAERFRASVLQNRRSFLWGDQAEWTGEAVAQLRGAFLEHPDLRKDRSFLEKLQGQLEGVDLEAHRVGVDVVAAMNLIPANATAAKKSSDVRTVASWRAEVALPDIGWLTPAYGLGIAHVGRFKDAQFGFVLLYVSALHDSNTDPYDIEACRRIADEVSRQISRGGEIMRHAFLYVWFPDNFEPIVSKDDRNQILTHFAQYRGDAAGDDVALQNIRTALSSEFGEAFSFYDPQVQAKWKRERPEPPRGDGETAGPRFWMEKTHVRGRPDREEGPYALGVALWSPVKSRSGADIYKSMREVHEGDVVFHLINDEHIVGWSHVEGTVRPLPDPPGREYSDVDCQYVPLRDYAPLRPPFHRDQFLVSPYLERLLPVLQTGKHHLFYNRHGALNQGAYFTSLPASVLSVLVEAAHAAGVDGLPPETAADGPGDRRGFTPELVRGKTVERKLRLPETTIRAAVAALKGGQHLLLVGPPGTGKTEFASALGQAAHEAGLSHGFQLTTATADWTSVDTVGGYRLTKSQRLEFQPGHVLEAIDQRKWLIVDEFNRADIDKALGQLFTVLSGQTVVLPFLEERDNEELRPAIVAINDKAPPRTHSHTVDPRWRLIATLNTRDRDLLFTMSYALLRRFAIIDVPVPTTAEYETIFDQKAATGITVLDKRLRSLMRFPRHRLGPAILIDCGAYLKARAEMESAPLTEQQADQLLKEAIFASVIPQLDNLSLPDLRAITAYVHRHILTTFSVVTVANLIADALRIPARDILPPSTQEVGDLSTITETADADDEAVAGEHEIADDYDDVESE